MCYILKNKMFEKIIEKEWEKVKRRFIPSVWGVVIEEGEHISINGEKEEVKTCLLYTSPSPRDLSKARMPSSA